MKRILPVVRATGPHSQKNAALRGEEALLLSPVAAQELEQVQAISEALAEVLS